ncbi:hypothetical protein PFISCL1PPCAC_10059, partial [Pristionchus fissidentatus]
QEWDLLREVMPTLPVDRIRKTDEFTTGRSFLAYSLLRDDECVGEAMDAIDRSCVDGPPKKLRNALCLVCHSPFSVSLLQPLQTPPHFNVDSHRHLAVKGWSEFKEVDEIAELPQGSNTDPQSTLAFSVFLHLSNEQDATPCKLFKWHCTLCSLDVSLFPSSISLRFFALRHLEQSHPRVFNDAFYNHEWKLLQIETSLLNMRTYSQQECIGFRGRPYDITDPSDFIFPWQRSLRVPAGFFVCGHCFFVSRGAEILDHLATHGYVVSDNRVVLEEGGQEGCIDEKTIRTIRKKLRVPSSILYEEKSSCEEMDGMRGEERMMVVRKEEIPATPVNRTEIEIVSTPKSSGYRLRARSVARRYVPIDDTTNNEDTMSSEESDSGVEKYVISTAESGDSEGDEERTLNDTMEVDEDENEPSTSSGLRRVKSERERKQMMKSSNTCTESSIASELYDTGIVPSGEKEHPFKRAGNTVHKKAFRWTGEEPAQLTAEQIELIRVFKESGRCDLCPKTKGYRGVSKMTNVEQSMMAHLIVRHGDDENAMAIVTRKRFLLCSSLLSGAMEAVPPFLLENVHPNYLTCSRCLEFKCGRQSNLAVHWESCSGVKGNRGKSVNARKEKREEEGEKEKEEEREERITPKRTSTHSVRCPLCREGWRKSVHYSDDVSVAVHLVLKHTTDKQAYEMVMQLEEETSLQSSFPFLNLHDSFAFRVRHSESGIQCALCDTNSPTLASAIRHATRSHATSKEKEEANIVVGGLSCPLPSSCSSLRSILMGIPRSILAIQFIHLLFNHQPEEEEAKQWMDAVAVEDKEKLRCEANLRLDVDKCIESWRDGKAYLVCALCDRVSRNISLHAKHFGAHCGEKNDRIVRRSVKTTPLFAPRTPAEVQSTEKRGRGKAPDRAMKCEHCERVIYASSLYAASVSMDIHLLKMHPQEQMMTAPSVFPFINFSASTADSLECSLCGYSAKESRYIVPHAWTKHTDESKAAAGLQAWAEFEEEQERKREKQRSSCSRTIRSLRAGAEMMKRQREEEGDEEEEENGEVGKKRRRVEGDDGATATVMIRTPRQRSTVSRWLDTSLQSMSTYSPSHKPDDDLRDRLDRLFSTNSPSLASQSTHASSSIFKELPETSMAQMTTQGKAEDISHIKGVDGVRCSVCSFKGRNTEALRIHFNEAHQGVTSLSVPDVFPCAVCSSVFNSKKKWRCHCEEDHAPKDRPFQCFKCQFRYETHQKLRAHQIRVHESEMLVHPDDRTCFKCSKLFGSLRAYREHKKRHEEREGIDEEEEE